MYIPILYELFERLLHIHHIIYLGASGSLLLVDMDFRIGNGL